MTVLSELSCRRLCCGVDDAWMIAIETSGEWDVVVLGFVAEGDVVVLGLLVGVTPSAHSLGTGALDGIVNLCKEWVTSDVAYVVCFEAASAVDTPFHLAMN